MGTREKWSVLGGPYLWVGLEECLGQGVWGQEDSNRSQQAK